jgi:redox-sensitive bicupin YhaK (pirin superfamily)
MKNALNMIIDPREKDIGIPVRRILPWAKKKMVGPFIFLDHMGPVHLKAPDAHVDVRPHPHIGLSTLTYLFEGSLLHRDSLGMVQEILPGEVNWMTAGKGISHSEREIEEKRKYDRELHGLQFWVALPKESEDQDPSFHHYDKADIPDYETEAASVHIVAGKAFGKTSPLKAHSPMIFMVTRAHKNGTFIHQADGHELALYIVKGSIKIENETYHEHQMIVLNRGSDLELTHSNDAVFAVVGGVPFEEPRYIWWNLVSSSEQKIAAAKKAWSDGSFPQVPHDAEKIPLPEI